MRKAFTTLALAALLAAGAGLAGCASSKCCDGNPACEKCMAAKPGCADCAKGACTKCQK
ncbi:MAG: hypothetical protein HUU06_03740 [Planctomycetaceae bacterium]|nr:hypothetical protein [Planctomycetota bacterium]NUN51889.1 hypothetical protein [Planctomycetaceae bacterium]